MPLGSNPFIIPPLSPLDDRPLSRVQINSIVLYVVSSLAVNMSSTSNDIVRLESRNLSLQYENQQWRHTNARLSKDNQRLMTELANVLQPPTAGPTHFGLQMEVYARDGQIAKFSEELQRMNMLNQALTEDICHANEEAKRAKDAQTQEFKSFYHERNAYEQTIAQRDSEVIGLKEGLTKKDIEWEQLRLELQERVSFIAGLQGTLDETRVEKHTCEKELACTLQELDEQQEHYCCRVEKLTKRKLLLAMFGNLLPKFVVWWLYSHP